MASQNAPDGAGNQHSASAMERTSAERKWLLALIALSGVTLLVWAFGLLLQASLLSYQEPIALDVPIAYILGRNYSGLAWFIAVLTLLWASYAAALWVAVRLASPMARTAAISSSILFTAITLFIYPGGSRDIWHNIVDGRLLWRYGANPLLTPPALARDLDPLVARITVAAGFINEASYYGPLWYTLTFPATLLGGDSLLANLLAFKLLPAAFFLLTLPLIALLADRLHPGSSVAAIVLYGWNPLLLWAFPLDGHNDSVMVFFLLLSLYSLAARRWETALPLLTLAILTKYTALLLWPLFLLLALKQDGKRALPRLGLGAVGSLLLAVALWLPFWAGPQTLRGLQVGSDRALNSLLAALMFLADPARRGADGVPVELRFTFTAAFVLTAIAILVLYIRKSRGAFADSVVASFALIFAYLVLQAWWFWPWYLAWLLPLGAVLVCQRSVAILATIYSASAMTITVLLGWRLLLVGNALSLYNLVVVLTTLGPPSAYLLFKVGQWSRHRAKSCRYL